MHSLSEIMSQLSDLAEKRAQDEKNAPPTGEDTDAPEEEDGPDSVPAPDSMDDAALRWGRYVVQHFEPQPGDLMIIKGPDEPGADKKRERMAQSIRHHLDRCGIEPVAFIIGPSHLVNVSQYPPDRMRDLGYERTGASPDFSQSDE